MTKRRFIVVLGGLALFLAGAAYGDAQSPRLREVRDSFGEAPISTEVAALVEPFGLKLDSTPFSRREERVAISFESGLPLAEVLNETCRTLSCVWWIAEGKLVFRDLPKQGADIEALWRESGVEVNLAGYRREPVPQDIPREMSEVLPLAARLCGKWSCRAKYYPAQRYLSFEPLPW